MQQEHVSAGYKLPPEALAYLSQLAAEIVASGNTEGDLIQEAIEAHARRQAFAREMAKGVSDRAKRARAVLCAHTYGQAIARTAIRQTFDNMEFAARHEFALSQAVSA